MFALDREPDLQTLSSSFLQKRDIALSVLRLDQIHPQISGNKWFKLKLNIEAIKKSGHSTVLSFGGAWSNHLLALANAGKLMGFDTIGVVRGEIDDPDNPVLAHLRSQGMRLHGVTRADYRMKAEPEFLDTLRQRFGDFYLLPEGGSNDLAVSGCREIVDYLHWQQPSRQQWLALACGTGATLAGIVLELAARQQTETRVLGVAVLKAPGYLEREVSRWLRHFGASLPADSSGESGVRWTVSDDYHCGGYAKRNRELDGFLQCFAEQSSLPVEPVYTGKLAYGLYRAICRGQIEPGTELIAIHTGGLGPNQAGAGSG
ncbi:MAG: pyridoxal-phosphate dependent enzyme [Gammaproteobacteria bacterium]